MENFSESVQIHDKYQFEVKFTYPLDRTKAESSYHVESYMFIPNNLCVNASTYSREDFFNDMQKYIRFKTPALLLRVLDQGPESPMAKLASTMTALAESGDPASMRDYEERMKLFCSIFKSALRDEEQFIESSSSDANFEELVANYLKNADDVLSKFRAMKINLQTPRVDKRALKLFELADEFASITAAKHFGRLALFLKGIGTPESLALRTKAVAAIDAETSHRVLFRYPSIPDDNSDNEALLYREGALKKIMASILFLRASTKREGRFIEQVLFGLAAGFAMAFATFIALYSRIPSMASRDFSLSFFMILVVAYMFKDRIKEIVRNYFSVKIRELLYDYRTDIFNALDKRVGICKESFNFVSESKIPPEIRRIRNRDYMSELANGCLGEDVILSRKSIQLISKGCERIFADFKVDGLVDIMRFNVRGFLEKMDNPNKEILLSSGGDIVVGKGRRVYYVHMIIRYGMAGREDSYRHFRLALSRNGIRRIEAAEGDSWRLAPTLA